MPKKHVPEKILGYYSQNQGWHKKESRVPGESVLIATNGKVFIRIPANWIKSLLADVIKHIGVANGKKT